MPPTTDNSANQYRILAFCNKWAGTRDMGVSIILKAGLVEKQSIGDVFEDRNLPASLAKLSSTSATWPAMGREFIRKDNTKYF
jgi:hypothetical protein